MSNLGLQLTQLLVPADKYGVKCPYGMTPKYITIHNTANDASARAEVSYMVGNWNEVSYHWAVDDIEAVQGVLHTRNAWHCGDGLGAGNMSSIGIEICYSLTPGHPRYAKAEDNGAKLTAILLKQYGWGIDRIRKHQDWSGKYCPHRILDNGNWEGFKARVQHYLNQLNGTMAQTQTDMKENGGDTMHFTFTVKGDKNYDDKTVYYYNGSENTIKGLAHSDEWHILKEMFKESTGRDLPHKNWSNTAPWYVRFIGATGAKRV